MTVLEEINNLKALGIYGGLLKKGIIPININFSLEISEYYRTRLTVNNEYPNAITRSYIEASEYFDVSEMTVRRAVKFINQ